MKESKCGKIPPCYGSLEFAIYEEAKKVNDEWKKSRALHGKLIDKLRGKLMEGGFLDDTHDKVYELNRQMCDIDKHLSEAGYFGRICEGQVKARKKLKDMEEKKIKKMTKAEAFEYLKGKKVRTCGEPRLLEKKLMECGYRWMRGVTWENDDYEDFWAYFMGYDGLITFVDIECSDYYECHNFKEISADDILSIEIVEECAKDDEDPYFGGRIKDLQEMLEDDEVLIITKTNFLTMTK